jgi:spore maturation protein CgeB
LTYSNARENGTDEFGDLANMALRIVIIGPDYPDSLERNLAAAFRRCGHIVQIVAPMTKVHESRWVKAGVEVGSKFKSTGAAIQRWLVDGFPQDVDLTVVTTSSAVLLWPETVKRLKLRSRYVVCWFVDAAVHFAAARFLASPYDRLFFTDRGLVTRACAGYGLPAEFLPEGADPRHHKPHGVHRSPFVAVVGSIRAERLSLLERLQAEESLDIRVFGGQVPPWATGALRRGVRFGPWLAESAKARVFSEAAAVLNNLHPAHIDAVNCRVFEAGGSGGLVVTESRPVLEELFSVDSDLLAYRTYEELAVHLRAAVSDPLAFESKRRAIAERVRQEHTLDHRAITLVRSVTSNA